MVNHAETSKKIEGGPHNRRDNPAPSPKKTDHTSWLSREESARLLGVSVQTIRNHEEKGHLKPEQASRIVNGKLQSITVHDPHALADLSKILKTANPHSLTADTSAWLTRNESADMLQVSPQTLKNYEKRGKLHPLKARRRDARGHEQSVIVYNPKELSRLPKGLIPFSLRSAGEMEARCFELFSQGKSFQEIVIATRETSERIHGLHERWLDDGGSLLVISSINKSALEAVLGPFKDVTELVELVTTKRSQEDKTP